MRLHYLPFGGINGHLLISNVLVGMSRYHMHNTQCRCYISVISYRVRRQQKQGENAVFNAVKMLFIQSILLRKVAKFRHMQDALLFTI